MKSALLFFFSLKLVHGCDFNILLSVVETVSNSNFFGCFVIFYSQEEINEKLYYEKLAKLFQIRFKYSMAVQISIEEYKQTTRKNESVNCLKIFNGQSKIIRQKFWSLLKEINLGDGDTWLIFLEEPIQPYLNSLTLQFDAQLITASTNNLTVNLKAPYKVAKNYPLRFQNLGSWTEPKGLDVPEIKLDVTKRDMEGLRLTAGTINYPPVTVIKPYKNGEFSVHGYLIKMWKEVSEKLNFTYKYILPPDKGVGSQISDGSWNGLMGMMIRNEIDVIVTALIMTPIRLGAVVFTVPVMTSGFQVFFLEQGNKLEWGSLLRPFRKESWLAILGWLLVAATLLSLVYSIGCSFEVENRLFEKEYTILGSIFIIFRAFTNQGNNRVPVSTSSRIILYLPYFLMAIIFPAYSAAFISYLTVKDPIRIFNSLEDMLKSGTHKIIPVQKTADYNFFSQAKDTLLQEVFQKLIQPVEESSLPQNPEEGIEMVCKLKNVAYFGCELSARMFAHEFFLKNGCKFMTFEQRVIYIYKGIVFPKNSPYYLAINAELKRIILSGLVHKFEKEVWSRKNEITEPCADPIEPRHVIQIYCVLLGGFFLSALIFIVEICNRKKASRDQKGEEKFKRDLVEKKGH